MILPTFLLCLLLSWPLHTSAQDSVRTCYWTNGATSSSTGDDFRSCDLNGPNGVSHCCAIGEACLDNGLCFAGSKGTIYRGGCTDDTWSQNTTACPKYCMAISGWADMLPCTPSLDPQIWCGNNSDSSVCKSGNGGEVYDYTPAAAMFVVNKTEAAATAACVAASSSAAAVAAAACTSGSDTGSCIAPAVPIGVGVGVGVPLLLACLVLGWLLVRERKNRNNGQSKGPEPISYVSETKDDRTRYGSPSPVPAYAPLSTRDELHQARKMQQQRTASQQHMSELETERGRSELGQ